jgi:copper homeostasis protein
MAFAELLATDLASVEHALAAGADRIELCAALEVGGVTPGIGFLRAAVRMAEETLSGAHVVALVRPRRGDFLVDGPRGVALLQAEVEAAKDVGAMGVAVGVLSAASHVDFAAMELLVRSAGAMKVTFHRAIDHVRDPLAAARELRSIGIARLLTSGGRSSATEGAGAIRAMVEAVGPDLEVIAAGGVHGGNAEAILAATGAPAIHGSCSHIVGSPGSAGNGAPEPPVPMGARQGALPENVRAVLDPASARAFVAAAHSSFPPA